MYIYARSRPCLALVIVLIPNFRQIIEKEKERERGIRLEKNEEIEWTHKSAEKPINFFSGELF